MMTKTAETEYMINDDDLYYNGDDKLKTNTCKQNDGQVT